MAAVAAQDSVGKVLRLLVAVVALAAVDSEVATLVVLQLMDKATLEALPVRLRMMSAVAVVVEPRSLDR
jgi:hypothetical protein